MITTCGNMEEKQRRPERKFVNLHIPNREFLLEHTVLEKRDPLTCYYCGLRHMEVEAGGMWHCPNRLCIGPGAAYWRTKLSSYMTEWRGDKHTVDSNEAVSVFLDYADTLPDGDPVKVAMYASATKWVENMDEARRTWRLSAVTEAITVDAKGKK